MHLCCALSPIEKVEYLKLAFDNELHIRLSLYRARETGLYLKANYEHVALPQETPPLYNRQ